LCNAPHLAVELRAISLLDKITTSYAHPLTQDSGYELPRMSERRSSSGELVAWLAVRARPPIRTGSSRPACHAASLPLLTVWSGTRTRGRTGPSRKPGFGGKIPCGSLSPKELYAGGHRCLALTQRDRLTAPVASQWGNFGDAGVAPRRMIKLWVGSVASDDVGRPVICLGGSITGLSRAARYSPDSGCHKVLLLMHCIGRRSAVGACSDFVGEWARRAYGSDIPGRGAGDGPPWV
jgi:hypothetical protein